MLKHHRERIAAGLFVAVIFFPSMLVSEFCQAQRKNYEPTKEQTKQMLDAIPTKEDKIFYDEIIVCDTSLNKDKIFIRLRQWFIENFMESKAVLEVNDIDNGLLSGKGTYKYTNYNGLNIHSGYTQFILNVSVKDGKFRYQLYDFTAYNNNKSLLASPGVSTNEKVDLNEMLTLYRKKKRVGYSRKFLEGMIELVYYIQHSIKDVSIQKQTIQDF